MPKNRLSHWLESRSVTLPLHASVRGLPRQRKKFPGFLIAVAVILASFTAPAAAVKKTEENGWEFSLLPYLWALSMKGNVTARGLKTDI